LSAALQKNTPLRSSLICAARLSTTLVRRVKCDEAKPSCYSCISTGRTCDGYEPNIEAPPALPITVSSAISRLPSVGFLGTEKERRAFNFFRQETAPQLSRFFGRDFCERLLLQAALHERSIRHAILALGSLHAKLEQDKGLITQNHSNGLTDDFALKNYNQAISILVEPLGQQAIDVCLICSILFACLEVSRSHLRPLFLLTVSRQCKAATALLSHMSRAA
jgi:hypothetical protein